MKKRDTVYINAKGEYMKKNLTKYEKICLKDVIYFVKLLNLVPSHRNIIAYYNHNENGFFFAFINANVTGYEKAKIVYEN